MARYLVTQKCQECKERRYQWREKGEIVDVPEGVPVPEWFKPLDGPPVEMPKPVTPDTIINGVYGELGSAAAPPVESDLPAEPETLAEMAKIQAAENPDPFGQVAVVNSKNLTADAAKAVVVKRPDPRKGKSPGRPKGKK